MPFQTTVFPQMGFGVPGQRYDNSPMRALSYTLRSADAAYNIVGATFFSVTSEGIAHAGANAGELIAGLLVDPEMQALYGTVGGGPLAASMLVPNEKVAACATMGRFVVTLPAAAALGDLVIFDNTTGAISTITPGSAMPSGKSTANATIIEFLPTAAGLAVIEIQPISPDYT